MLSVAGEPGAERRGLVRIVLAELIDEGAGEDRAVAAVRAFKGCSQGKPRRHNASSFGLRGEAWRSIPAG